MFIYTVVSIPWKVAFIIAFSCLPTEAIFGMSHVCSLKSWYTIVQWFSNAFAVGCTFGNGWMTICLLEVMSSTRNWCHGWKWHLPLSDFPLVWHLWILEYQIGQSSTSSGRRLPIDMSNSVLLSLFWSPMWLLDAGNSGVQCTPFQCTHFHGM